MVSPRDRDQNSKRILKHISHLEKPLVTEIMETTNKGVPRTISPYAFATPHGVKANCYAFFLTLPPSQWKDRHAKTQPGDACPMEHATKPLQFMNRDLVKRQLVRRVLCDNENVVHFLKPRGSYAREILTMKLPDGYVLGVCIVGDADYHFCRRESIGNVLNNPVFRKIWSQGNGKGVRQQLVNLQKNRHEYCWSHVAGWSGRVKLVDADGRVITNPVDAQTTSKNAVEFQPDGCNHNYHKSGLHYNTLVGFFIIRARAATLNPERQFNRDENLVKARLRNLTGSSMASLPNRPTLPRAPRL